MQNKTSEELASEAQAASDRSTQSWKLREGPSQPVVAAASESTFYVCARLDAIAAQSEQQHLEIKTLLESIVTLLTPSL